KAHDDVAAVDLSHEGRLFEGNGQQVAPGRAFAVTYAHHRFQVAIEGGGGADHKVGIGGPANDVAEVGRIENCRAGLEIDAIDVEDAAIAKVQCNQDLSWL